MFTNCATACCHHQGLGAGLESVTEFVLFRGLSGTGIPGDCARDSGKSGSEAASGSGTNQAGAGMTGEMASVYIQGQTRFHWHDFFRRKCFPTGGSYFCSAWKVPEGLQIPCREKGSQSWNFRAMMNKAARRSLDCSRSIGKTWLVQSSRSLEKHVIWNPWRTLILNLRNLSIAGRSLVHAPTLNLNVVFWQQLDHLNHHISDSLILPVGLLLSWRSSPNRLMTDIGGVIVWCVPRVTQMALVNLDQEPCNVTTVRVLIVAWGAKHYSTNVESLQARIQHSQEETVRSF